MQCMFPRVVYKCQLKGFCISVELEESGLTSQSDQPSGVLVCPQRSFSEELLTPKDGSSSSWRVYPIEFTRWILEACADRVSFLKACVRWNGVTNVDLHLIYKPHSYWRILFRSKVCPRQFSCLENFRALVVPVGGFFKGVILQLIMTPIWVLPNVHSFLRRKGGVTGASAHAPRQGNSTYIQAFRRSIYNTKRPQHTHLPIFQYKRHPQGSPSRPHYSPVQSSVYTFITSYYANYPSTLSMWRFPNISITNYCSSAFSFLIYPNSRLFSHRQKIHHKARAYIPAAEATLPPSPVSGDGWPARKLKEGGGCRPVSPAAHPNQRTWPTT